MKSSEWIVYVAIMGALAALIFVEGSRAAALERRVPLGAQELYRQLAKSRVKLQIIDARTLADYDDAHVPGALPMPGCELAQAPEAAREHVIASMPTIIVTANGDAAALAACGEHFRFVSARTLAGGMTAWSDANLPEDSGEYVPPKPGAGGGCL